MNLSVSRVVGDIMKSKNGYTAGIDWISATRVINDDLSFFAIAKEIQKKYPFEKFVPGKIYGYKGDFYRGSGCGHMFYGENRAVFPAREMIQLGGELSDFYWPKVYFASDNVSRLDLRVDVEIKPAQNDIAEICYDEMQKMKSEGMLNVKTCSLIKGTKGQTLYVGSRQSDSYGRLYDKSAEQKEEVHGKIWRYEIELKGRYAKQAVEKLQSVFEVGRSAGLRSIGMFVWNWFDSRGVPPMFHFTAKNTQRIELTSVGEKGNTLVWLRQQVSPTIRRMIAQGRGGEAFRALLGLDEINEHVLREILGSGV